MAKLFGRSSFRYCWSTSGVGQEWGSQQFQFIQSLPYNFSLPLKLARPNRLGMFKWRLTREAWLELRGSYVEPPTVNNQSIPEFGKQRSLSGQIKINSIVWLLTSPRININRMPRDKINQSVLSCFPMTIMILQITSNKQEMNMISKYNHATDLRTKTDAWSFCVRGLLMRYARSLILRPSSPSTHSLLQSISFTQNVMIVKQMCSLVLHWWNVCYDSFRLLSLSSSKRFTDVKSISTL